LFSEYLEIKGVKMRFWCTDDAHLGWRHPIGLVICAPTREAAAQEFNTRLQPYSKMILANDLKEWDFEKNPVLILAKGMHIPNGADFKL
jgi:hypothetical protein